MGIKSKDLRVRVLVRRDPPRRHAAQASSLSPEPPDSAFKCSDFETYPLGPVLLAFGLDREGRELETFSASPSFRLLEASPNPTPDENTGKSFLKKWI